uniref:RanBD1 domain-containing protein n=1 Tax=Peronospora matthiolae TaxID=2874970 RepID=A0AAV1T9Q1_9STRA
MASKGEHEKPETIEDEHQPIVKKVRLDMDAKVTEDVKKVKIDENAAPQPEIGGHEAVVENDSVSTTSPVAEKELGADVVENKDVDKGDGCHVSSTTTTSSSSAFSGFSAFRGTDALAQVIVPTCMVNTAPASSSGAGAEVVAAQVSKEVEQVTFVPVPSTAKMSSSSGFASFQSNSSATFASFAAVQSTSEGFGEKASASLSTDFLADADAVKKPNCVVPALSEAELANGEEEEQLLVEKRTKLFKLVEKDYAEVGVGPLRVLNMKDAKTETDKYTARLVMRRESYPHGPGTKLLINTSLRSCLLCEKKTEKTMLLTVLEETKEDLEAETKVIPVTYLMRFESPDDLDVVKARIQTHLHLPEAATSLN